MRVSTLTDEKIPELLGRVNPRLKRELEEELSWRVHTGKSIRAPHEFVPAWLVASALQGHRR